MEKYRFVQSMLDEMDYKIEGEVIASLGMEKSTG